MSWGRLLQVAAAADLVLLLIIGITLGDAETIAFAVVVALTSAWLVYRPSRIAVVGRALVFADVEVFMVLGLVSNLANHEQLGALIAPLVLAVSSAVGLVATAGYLASGRRAGAGRRSAAAVGAGALAALLGGSVVAVATAGNPAGERAGDDLLRTKNAKFSSTHLVATGPVVTVDVANDDLFWHTFSIDSLGVDLRVPVKGHRRVTFNARPGTYEFHCAIPGHAAIGMRGRLVVG